MDKPLVKKLTDTVEKGLALLADAIVGVTPPLAEKFHKQRENRRVQLHLAEIF